MTQFKKEIAIPHIPIWINQWIQDNFDDSTYKKYLEASSIHAQIVNSAIDAGDCVITCGDGFNTSLSINWTNQDIHMEYMSKIPEESHNFYMKMWALYYEAANTDVQINFKD